jgi:hypothetical protein
VLARRDGLGGRADPLPAPRGPLNPLGAVTLIAEMRRGAVDDTWLTELAAAGPRCATLADVVDACGKRRPGAVALHDSVAVLEAAVPGTLATTSMSLEAVCDHGGNPGAVLAEPACTQRTAPCRWRAMPT